MPNARIVDIRGWDESDHFTLPVIGAIQTLEQEGFLKEDIPKRMKTVGDSSLALSEQLDYFSFDIVPRLNLLFRTFRKNPSSRRDNALLTQIGRTLIDGIKAQNIINDYIKRFIVEIGHYAGLYDFQDWDKLNNNEKEEFLKRGKEILKDAQVGEDFSGYYTFISRNRNFAEHDGSLIPHELNADEIIFLKRNSDLSSKISSREILTELNKFKEIREKTLKKLKDPEFWRKHLTESQD
ncbi:MAG: hypothetical protein UR34_C0011G0021 [candidate division WS6 bacterium GW2011_GWC1_33_20]|uniref:Uncharacterized protein n=1 Tax=candidate division WS6 bacterium GW2011_GWC1_33_20 TaxID=1619089 RepID=A0A0G0CK13_9BACT|nr:MAG: hypothetical protein UR34_C0011G0021 [candidate division WS6 bacterium GW2011_GWC1_33_20]OGC38171.1 MAG: hypothetical protein A2436_01365 [candidate division WS6 bacterium RIFOXYC1_FULL_33_9]